ncbi:Biofilm regulator 1 [Yarrowia sp. C11]|nr:Biofilm regulator 1 [Yarrowia sp. C11]KAG5371116.1 Biofilm regulator 1 [Yarrowia sp. E02]
MIASATPRPERYVLSPVSPHAKVEMSKNDPSTFYKSEVRLPPMRMLETQSSLPVNIPPLNYTPFDGATNTNTNPHTPNVGPSNPPVASLSNTPNVGTLPPPGPHSMSSTPISTTPIPHIHSQAPTPQPQPVQLQPVQQQHHHIQQQQQPPPPQHLPQPLSQPPPPQHAPQQLPQLPMSQPPPMLHQPTPLPPPPQHNTTPQPYGHPIPPPMPMTHPMMPPYFTPFSGQDFKRKTFESKDTASHMYQMISQLETFVQSHGGDMRNMAHAATSPNSPLPSIDALNAMILRLRSCSAIFDEWRDNVVAIHQAAASSQTTNSQFPPKTTPPASPLFINTNTKRKRKRSRSDASTTVCRGCGTTETPEWRKGPEGARTLCNACGLYHAKLAKRKGINVAGEAIRQKRMRTNLSE